MQNTKIPNFRRCIVQNFPFIENTFDALTDYQLLCKVVEYLNKVIDQQNNVTEQTVQLTNAFNELKSYVETYFDNLDVQEEINNKLEDMAQDGTLPEIIASYLNTNALWNFDDAASMKAATNLIVGSFAKVNNHDGNDEHYANYKIREAESGETADGFNTILLNNGLIAELVKASNYLPLTVQHIRFEGVKNKTDVWYSIIPKEYSPELFLANDAVDQVEDSSENATRNMTTLSINAGIFNETNQQTTGIVINNSQLLKHNDAGTKGRYIIYCLADGTLNAIESTATTAEVQALNPVWAIRGFWPVFLNGVDMSGIRDPEDYQPRSFIGQDSEGNYLIGTSLGRDYRQQGLTAVDLKNLCQTIGFNPYFLFNLDGGGSCSLNYHGQRVNDLINFESRKVANFIGFRDKSAGLKDSFKTALTSSTNLVHTQNELQSYNINERLVADETSVTDYGLSLRPSSHASYTGEMVTLNLYFTNSTEMPHYAKIIKGLPAPRGGQRLTVIIHGHATASANTLVTRQGYITQYGELNNDNQGKIPAGEWFINASYIGVRDITPERPES